MLQRDLTKNLKIRNWWKIDNFGSDPMAKQALTWKDFKLEQCHTIKPNIYMDDKKNHGNLNPLQCVSSLFIVIWTIPFPEHPKRLLWDKSHRKILACFLNLRARDIVANTATLSQANHDYNDQLGHSQCLIRIRTLEENLALARRKDR